MIFNSKLVKNFKEWRNIMNLSVRERENRLTAG